MYDSWSYENIWIKEGNESEEIVRKVSEWKPVLMIWQIIGLLRSTVVYIKDFGCERDDRCSGRTVES